MLQNYQNQVIVGDENSDYDVSAYVDNLIARLTWASQGCSITPEKRTHENTSSTTTHETLHDQAMSSCSYQNNAYSQTAIHILPIEDRRKIFPFPYLQSPDQEENPISNHECNNYESDFATAETRLRIILSRLQYYFKSELTIQENRMDRVGISTSDPNEKNINTTESSPLVTNHDSSSSSSDVDCISSSLGKTFSYCFLTMKNCFVVQPESIDMTSTFEDGSYDGNQLSYSRLITKLNLWDGYGSFT